MPPAKGDLTATKAILGLFVSEPSTAMNIKARLRREYPHAGWSPSIVNTTIPSLVDQKFIVLVRAGSKPSEHFYEATDSGVAEFKRWMAESPRAPEPLRDPFLVWIRHSTEDELPKLITLAREQEEEASVELEKARERLNRERERGNLDSADWNGRVRYMVLSRMALAWNSRVELAKDLRLNLRQGYDKHMRMPGDDDA
jgi:DNA-binding PadR family transcriptional regulator